jgi:hypothetical protein
MTNRPARITQAEIERLIRAVVALTATEAAIQGATTVLIYRKQRKPVIGAVGDSLDDWVSS